MHILLKQCFSSTLCWERGEGERGRGEERRREERRRRGGGRRAHAGGNPSSLISISFLVFCISPSPPSHCLLVVALLCSPVFASSPPIQVDFLHVYPSSPYYFPNEICATSSRLRLARAVCRYILTACRSASPSSIACSVSVRIHSESSRRCVSLCTCAVMRSNSPRCAHACVLLCSHAHECRVSPFDGAR